MAVLAYRTAVVACRAVNDRHLIGVAHFQTTMEQCDTLSELALTSIEAGLLRRRINGTGFVRLPTSGNICTTVRHCFAMFNLLGLLRGRW